MDIGKFPFKKSTVKVGITGGTGVMGKTLVELMSFDRDLNREYCTKDLYIVTGIPGTGHELITLSSTFDVARFVQAAFEMTEWLRENRVVGESLAVNQLITLAEDATREKFDVKYHSLEALKEFQITELPGHENGYKEYTKEVLFPFLSILHRWMAEGLASISTEASLNEKSADIKPLTAQKLMGEH